ncbi:hypothetical protein GCM10010512_05960 [Streptomyces thermoviolaceus subsp. thermoviolaceus]|nr:hypothetical protein GCM10010512_05960 [Streptomyces thermoviolaceus subsp. thermoviolaceus]
MARDRWPVLGRVAPTAAVPGPSGDRPPWASSATGVLVKWTVAYLGWLAWVAVVALIVARGFAT